MNPTTLSRRTVLRGIGTAIALPMLEAMTRQSVLASTAPKAPTRMAFMYVPNGIHMENWTPSKEGFGYDLKPILEPLSPHQSEMTVLTGLTLNGARALGDGPGDHARSVAAFLTGAHPHKTSGADIRNGISVDQVAAQQIGKATKFASLELGLEPSAKAGSCDSGYSCIYSSNMSWRSETSPMSKEIDPRILFDRLFGAGPKAERGKGLSKRERYQLSVLDLALEEAKSLRRQLGVSDQRKLDEYLYAVRDIEHRLAGADKLDRREDLDDVPDYPRPAGTPRDLGEHVRLMFDLMVLAMQTDQTRILSLMYTNAGSNRSYRNIGISDGHHNLSHHGRDREKQAKISQINHFHVQQLAYFIDKLRSVKEGDGTLLDHSMIVYGSGISDGNRHNHDDLPILLFGRGGGTITPGRHVRYRRDTPLTNLYLSMLDRMGCQIDTFSDSTGRLRDLQV